MISPDNATIDVRYSMQQVMVVAPINTQHNKTQDITNQHRQQGFNNFPAGTMWNPKFQHHNRDKDGYHTSAKCFQAGLGHVGSLWRLNIDYYNLKFEI